MGERMIANEDGTFTVHVHGPVADKMIALLTENSDLREALAKSASREAALMEKLKLAEEALKEISLNYWRPGDDFCHPEGCGSPGVANAALAKIKEAS